MSAPASRVVGLPAPVLCAGVSPIMGPNPIMAAPIPGRTAFQWPPRTVSARWVTIRTPGERELLHAPLSCPFLFPGRGLLAEDGQRRGGGLVAVWLAVSLMHKLGGDNLQCDIRSP